MTTYIYIYIERYIHTVHELSIPSWLGTQIWVTIGTSKGMYIYIYGGNVKNGMGIDQLQQY